MIKKKEQGTKNKIAILISDLDLDHVPVSPCVVRPCTSLSLSNTVVVAIAVAVAVAVDDIGISWPVLALPGLAWPGSFFVLCSLIFDLCSLYS